MKNKKDQPQRYDRNSRRTTMFKKDNQFSVGRRNALGGNPNKRTRDIEIIHDYIVFMNTEKEPLKVIRQYMKESRDRFFHVCETFYNEIGHVDFDILAGKLHHEFKKKKLKTFGRNLNPTENEAIIFLSEKYHLSQEAISSIISKYRTPLSKKDNGVPAIIHLPPKRIYLRGVTHQQHLESERAHIDYMESEIINDIQEQQYKNEKDRQLDIENTKQHSNELRQALTQLERRAREEPSGKAYITSVTPRPSYLHNIMRSELHEKHEISRIEWIKKLKNK